MEAQFTRSRVIRLGATLAAGVVLGACGTSSQPAPAATAPAARPPTAVPPTAQPTPAPVATKAPVPLLHWFGYAPPHRFGLAQKAVLDDFVSRNPGRIG